MWNANKKDNKLMKISYFIQCVLIIPINPFSAHTISLCPSNSLVIIILINKILRKMNIKLAKYLNAQFMQADMGMATK